MLIVDLFLDVLFFFKQKTAYEMRISDWSSDVCSSDLFAIGERRHCLSGFHERLIDKACARPRQQPPRSPIGLDTGAVIEHGMTSTLQFVHQVPDQIGRASCRERVCKYV